MMRDLVSQRVLGAIRFIDGNSLLPVWTPVKITADQLAIRRNRSGLYVLIPEEPELRDLYRKAFEKQPDDPAVGELTFELTIADAGPHYLPCRHTIKLPRDPDPAADDSLFKPEEIALFSAPTAAAQPGWAILRIVVLAEDGKPIPGAYIRVTRTPQNGDDDNKLLARGLTEWRGRAAGEAMVGVPGIPVVTWSETESENGNEDDDDHGGEEDNETDKVVRFTLAATVTAYINPLFNPESGALPNPVLLEQGHAALKSISAQTQLSAGQTTSLTLQEEGE